MGGQRVIWKMLTVGERGSRRVRRAAPAREGLCGHAVRGRSRPYPGGRRPCVRWPQSQRPAGEVPACPLRHRAPHRLRHRRPPLLHEPGPSSPQVQSCTATWPPDASLMSSSASSTGSDPRTGGSPSDSARGTTSSTGGTPSTWPWSWGIATGAGTGSSRGTKTCGAISPSWTRGAPPACSWTGPPLVARTAAHPSAPCPPGTLRAESAATPTRITPPPTAATTTGTPSYGVSTCSTSSGKPSPGTLPADSGRCSTCGRSTPTTWPS